MIDFHSHILPEIDDGSRSVEESLSLLQASAAQGITAMVATPHFYADQNTPQRFLQRRWEAWCRLAPHLTEELPTVFLGAEVHYFEGIARTEDVLCLRMVGTKLLLLEMPFSRWSERMIDDVLLLNRRPDVQVILAHIERYLADQEKDVVGLMLKNGVVIQSNADNFLQRWGSRQAFKMLQDGQIQILCSDCHNVDRRPQRIGEALTAIEKKLGADAAERLKENSLRLLQKHRL